MRNNNRQLDDVCLDCMDKISPKEKHPNCKFCPVEILKKVNNKILNNEFKKEHING